MKEATGKRDRHGSALMKVLIGLIALNIIFFSGYYIYRNVLQPEVQGFGNFNYDPNIKKALENVSSDVRQFYGNMRFNHNRISYYINPECEPTKVSRMKEAFEIISDGISNIVTFYPASESRADVLVGCSRDSYEKEENIFIAGEGGPTKIINSSMPVIIRGKVLLYNESRAICEEPLLEIHELLHVFGYDHIDNPKYVMYPYLNCNQEINPKLMEHMAQLYSVEPFAEVYFNKNEIYAEKERYLGRWYLNLNISIDNAGIIDAENCALKVYAGDEDKLLKIFGAADGIDTISFGGGERFYVKNLPLSPQDAQKIKFEISTTTKESNIENNVIELEI